jgi:hypothetical protein
VAKAQRWAAGVALTALLVAGCGGQDKLKKSAPNSSAHSNVVSDTGASPSTPTETSQPTQIQLVGKGFSQLRPDSIGASYLSYAVVVRNPNPGQIAKSVQVTVTFTDRGGQPVDTENETIDVLLPGQTAAVGDGVSGKGAVQMEVQALADSWEVAESELGNFAASQVHTTKDDYGSVTTNARLTSTFAKDIHNAKAVAVYYNSAGRIVGGAFTFVDFVPAGRSIGIKIDGSSAPPGRIARTAVYTAPSNLSLGSP